MTNLKQERWRQWFENFEKPYLLLSKYAGQRLENELERAGVIQFFKMTFELALEILKDYLEFQGYNVKSPRETIIQAYQIEVIDDCHTWLEALSKRNLTAYTYDDQMAEKMVQEIKEHFYPELPKLYTRLKEEV